jgi:hypothetical protein
MQEYKTIHFHLFRPEKALFKQSRNERAEVQIISCCNSENCGLFKRGECSFRISFSPSRCPYGRYHRYTGFTRKAQKYSNWCIEQEKRYEGIKFLDRPKIMAIVGDYIFLPYSHMDMYKDLPWSGPFLKKEDFTVETVLKLINFRPRAFLFNSGITSYQKEVPPLFLKHLSEQMPDLFNQVIKADEGAREHFKIFSNIGRKAILETITPNIGQLKDIYGGLWYWDGKSLCSRNSHASFMLISKFKELILVPEEKQIVTITDEEQVNKETIFIN